MPSHGTVTALNFTHPVAVWNGFLEFGVGTPFSSRGGGENTDTIRRPTRVPTKTQRRDIIILIRVYCKMGDTGMTGSTGTTGLYPYPFPGISGPTGPVYIMTFEELQQYHDTTVQSETTDKANMNVIVNPSTSGIQQNLIQWASAGFTHDYQVLSISLIRPSPCADGQVRDMMSYISYLTGSDIMTLTTKFQKKFLGIYFSYSISGNTVMLHASKVPTA